MDNINNNRNIQIDPNPHRKIRRKQVPLINKVLKKNFLNKVRKEDEFFQSNAPRFGACCYKVFQAKHLLAEFCKKIKLFEDKKILYQNEKTLLEDKESLYKDMEILWPEIKRYGEQLESFLTRINNVFWDKIVPAKKTAQKEEWLLYCKLINLFNTSILRRFNTVCKKIMYQGN